MKSAVPSETIRLQIETIGVREMNRTRKFHEYLIEAECVFAIAAVTATLLWIIAATSPDFIAGKVISVMVIAVAILTASAVYGSINR
jgi:hypothetical protein